MLDQFTFSSDVLSDCLRLLPEERMVNVDCQYNLWVL